MIEVAGLCKTFGQVRALVDVGFSVARGRIVGFLGANGAGKTTTMDILCGCVGADAGTARICGFDISEQPLEAKRRLGYLPDMPPLHGEMAVDDFIRYAARLRQVPTSDLDRRTSDVIERLTLGDVRNRLVGNLSKGFRQRVALAQALVHHPDVLVLDEPTEGLDPAQIVQIRQLIKSLAGDHTVLLSSHILSEVQNTCDDLVIIHQGRIVRQGTVQELTEAMEQGHLYRMRVAVNRSGLMESLSRLPSIGAVQCADEDESIEFHVPASSADTLVEQAARLAVEGGHGLRELAIKTRSLEEVFFQLTR
jgi:ABC-2 type transport system ATP-binding protein